jgi:hypothetical protein
MKALLFVALLTSCSCSRYVKVEFHPAKNMNNIPIPAYSTCQILKPIFMWGAKEYSVECMGDDSLTECRNACNEVASAYL